MRNPYDRFWIRVAFIVSIVVVVIGFPAFQRAKGFPGSMLGTLAAIAGVSILPWRSLK